MAQNDELPFNKKEASLFSTDTRLTDSIGWVRSPFLDNWYVQAQLGGQIYFGLEDNLGPFIGSNPLTDGRLTYNGFLNIGRWVYPRVGYRLGVGMGYAHGFLSHDTYNAYRNSINGGDGQHEEGLSGYYWNYNDSLYIQKWSYTTLSGELMLNLSPRHSILNGRFNTWGYAGAGFHFGMNERHNTKDGSVREPNTAAEIHAGLIEQVRINSRWSIYADVRFVNMKKEFDREWVSGVEKVGYGIGKDDYQVYFHLGASYRFHWRTEAQRTEWYDANSAAQIRQEERHVYNAYQVSVQTLDYVDILYSYDTVNEDPSENPVLQRRARERALEVIDSVSNAFNKDCAESTLDDIFSRHLLPYEMVFFDLDKWNIRHNEEVKIAKMASVMKAFPTRKFLLLGSADSKTGTPKRNNFLSNNRVDVVYNKLVYEYDIDSTQLIREPLGGILDYNPYELNRATVIIMDHPRVLEEFRKLKAVHKAGGAEVETNNQ